MINLIISCVLMAFFSVSFVLGNETAMIGVVLGALSVWFFTIMEAMKVPAPKFDERITKLEQEVLGLPLAAVSTDLAAMKTEINTLKNALQIKQLGR